MSNYIVECQVNANDDEWLKANREKMIELANITTKQTVIGQVVYQVTTIVFSAITQTWHVNVDGIVYVLSSREGWVEVLT